MTTDKPQQRPTKTDTSAAAALTPHQCQVTILMATYNGAHDLPNQLDSLLNQTHQAWSLVVSDDGSTDTTQDVLRAFADRIRPQNTTICEGPQQGAAANFMFLLKNLPSNESQDTAYVAFCDQDDIWLPDRLSLGLTALSAVPNDIPALYCSRTLIADHKGKRRLSSPRPRATSFRNALVQNIAAGNTILLNPEAAHLIRRAACQVDKVVMHDWWVYQLITGTGGQVIHDDTPTVIYRQHGSNVIGANDSIIAKLGRVWQVLRGDFGKWNTTNIAALTAASDVLTPENRSLLSSFAQCRTAPLMERLRAIQVLGLYRQSWASTAALYIATALRKI